MLSTQQHIYSALLLISIIFFNILLSVLVATGHIQKEVFTFYIIILNAAAYFIYYVSMKIAHAEKIPNHALVYGVTSILFWFAAIYFFEKGVNDWTSVMSSLRNLIFASLLLVTLSIPSCVDGEFSSVTEINVRTVFAKTAAQNRASAAECVLFGYYDFHDVWHLLSSLASFFSLLTVTSLDDDILISRPFSQEITSF
ncbi:unnamed protein product [Gongylonema pulchrum]|uniref:MARVEL domain-containing protein n=1 Tax=Gongylonema pulchrum TaxID=637853 RepID=A0A183DYU3_9BILA|nr:unnamed protein product [Gongylonema pulchrum]